MRLIQSVAARWLGDDIYRFKEPFNGTEKLFRAVCQVTMQPNTTSCAARPEFHLIGAHTISVRLEATL